SSACVTSTDDNLRSRICAATSVSESSAGSLNRSSSLACDGHEARRLDLERELQIELSHAPDCEIGRPGSSRGRVSLDRHAGGRGKCPDPLGCPSLTHPSTLMFASLTTFAHFAISAWTNAAKCGGVSPTPWKPIAASRSFTSGAASALATSACSLST